MNAIIDFIKKHPNFFMALSYFGIIWPLYVIINHYELHHHFPRHSLETKWDKMIPFVPQWVYFYGSMYAFVILPFIYVRNHLIYKRMWLSFCLTGLIAYVVFLVYPTYDIMRPVTNPFDFSRFFLALDNEHDSPYNCFPSLHVGFSMTAAFWVYFVDRSKIGLSIFIWGCLVSLSVLFVKEHYIADLLFGLVLSGSLFFYLSRGLRNILPQPASQWTNNKKWLLVPVGLYILELAYVLIKYSEKFNNII